MDKQMELIGKAMAQAVHYSHNWEEPMNMDYIGDIVDAFRLELMQLNGEED